jgi:multiple sugar transport system permease protein
MPDRAYDSAMSRAAWLGIAPAVLLLATIQGYPIVRGVYLSLTDTSLLSPNISRFVGLANFTRLFGSPFFEKTIAVTLVYAAGSVIGAIGLGLLAALLMNSDFLGRRLVRSVILVPWATPQVAVALVFIWIFNPDYGVLNFALKSVGAASENVLWLNDPGVGMISVLLVTIWKIFPFSALVLLAALQSIPASHEEAARIDGAKGLAMLTEITLPGIRRTVLVLVLFLTIWSLRRFELIWLLTRGGPVRATNTLVIDLYREAFINARLGQGAAIGVIGFLASIIITIIYYRVERSSTRRAGES